MSSLYVHIPFCRHICAYCDFPKVLFREEWAFSYVEELKKDLLFYGKGDFDTIYIGGGTPSALPLPLLEDLLSFLSPYLREKGEFTIEMNPEDASRELFRLLRKYRVNRLSMGMESASERLLKLMKRKAGYGQVKQAVSLAKEEGFSNISVDLIYALPDETMEELKADLSYLFSLSLPHWSAYSLSINPGTLFHHAGYKEMDEEEAAKQYEEILAQARKRGYRRYEVSNFAKEGYESRHNMAYWKDEEYLAIGLGASGYHEGIRYRLTPNLAAYLSGTRRIEEEVVTIEEDKKYFFLTNLRLEEGFALEDYSRRFSSSFLDEYGSVASKLEKQGLLKQEKGRLFCTDKGLLLLDRVLVELY